MPLEVSETFAAARNAEEHHRYTSAESAPITGWPDHISNFHKWTCGGAANGDAGLPAVAAAKAGLEGIALAAAPPAPMSLELLNNRVAEELYRLRVMHELANTIERECSKVNNDATATKNARDMLPHWIIHCRNDPEYRQACDKYIGSRLHTSGLSDRILVGHTGSVSKRDGTGSGVLMKTLNQYEGMARIDGGGGEEVKIELSDWRHTDEAKMVPLHPDVCLPMGEVDVRGSGMPVYLRCFKITNGDKRGANVLAAKITKAAAEARESLSRHRSAVKAPGGIPTVVTVEEGEGENAEVVRFGVALEDGTGGKPHVQEITARHYAKLRALFFVHNSGASSDEKVIQQRFHLSLAQVLMRYAAVAGPHEAESSGFHSAIHPECARALAAELGVVAEGFAMPMNTNTPLFGSLFPDVDAAFGSMGSMFDFNPTVGAFHINPPFDTIVMTQLQHHLLKLLEAAEATSSPLTFFVVIPHGWDEKVTAAVSALTSSKFSRAKRVLDQASIVYVGGSQHRLQRPYFRIKWDTSVALLATSAAAGPDGQGLTAKFDSVLASWTAAVEDVNALRKRQRE